MKRATKMMLMSSSKRGQDGDWASRSRENYGMEDKSRDRRGREHYDNGRFSPMRNENGAWIEGGYHDSRDRHRSDDGRYAPMRDTYLDETDMLYYYGYPHIPPVYGGNDSRYDRRERESMRPMNKIGFSISDEGEMEKSIPHEFNHDFNRDEMEYRKGSERMGGYGATNGYIPFTPQMGEEWTSNMKNEDGTHGAHWTMEQAKQVMSQRGIECDTMQFWVAINMIYSDYVKAAKAHNVGNKIEFYADMAKAFLDDKDAQPDKLARYYEYIVKH